MRVILSSRRDPRCIVGTAALCLLNPFSLRAFAQSPAEEKPIPAQHKFVTFEDARATIEMYADSGLPGSTLDNSHAWDQWIRQQDREVRSRIDGGIEDSICNLLLFGTSFTKLPRLESPDAALDLPSATLTLPARLRVHSLVAAVGAVIRNERIEFVRAFLQKKRISPAARQDYLAANLVRYVNEHLEYQRKLEQSAKSASSAEAISTRGTLYAQRGLSVDTSLLPNFAIDDTLRVLLAKGALLPGQMRTVAVVGPGLDFTDKRDGYDFYPLQTIQPFAVMESVDRLGLGNRSKLRVVTLDLNAAVNAHVAALAAAGKSGRPYVVQLPRDDDANWTSEAIQYWQHFGDALGREVRPLPVPDQLPSVKVRAVAIPATLAAAISPMDVNIVTQHLESVTHQRFDLVIATNILVYYDHFQQALAMRNIADMLNTGGIFISNTPLPTAHDERLKFLGGRSVKYARDGSYGDDIVVYTKR